MTDNPWALGFMVILALAYVGPLLRETGMDMWRRKRETNMSDDQTDEPTTQIYDSLPPQDRAVADDVIAASRAEGQDGSWRTVTDGPIVPAGEPTGRTGDDDPASERQPAPQPSRHILSAQPIRARMAVPAARVSATREPCPHCEGTGYMPSISDLLRESASWISDMDGVVVAFYTKLLEIAREDAERAAWATGDDQAAAGDEAVADAAFIFPPDLIAAAAGDADSRGAGQRDKLAKALVDIATYFDPADPEKMERLGNVIRSMANRHGAFVRRDGTIRGATDEEYVQVHRALAYVLGTLPKLTPAHAEAWNLAYQHVSGGMQYFQQAAVAPRFPRV